MNQPTTAIDYPALTEALTSVELTHGRGSDAHHACSIAFLNLQLTGELTDELHPCMSPVVRSWVIAVQDAMPLDMLAAGDEHGDRWRAVLPYVAGSATAGPTDAERVAILLDWMWACLSYEWETWVPESAHDAWRTMLTERTPTAADAAATAAAARVAKYAYADAAYAAYADAAARFAAWRAFDPARVLALLNQAPKVDA